MIAAPLSGRDAELFAQAQRAATGGNPAQAAQLLAQLITAGQRHVDVLMLYSAVCEPLGKTADALGACQAAAQAAPDRADIQANLGRLLLAQGRGAEALMALEQGAQLDSRQSEIWYNLGLAASQVGHHERAALALARAVELAPDWAQAWATLGFVQEQSGELARAEASLKRALVLEPQLPFARHYMAVTLRQLGKFQDALSWTDGVDLPETRLLRAHLLADVEPSEAVTTYRAVLHERPDLIDGHETLARLLPQLGRSREALDTYREALASAPSPQLYLSALHSARSLGDFESMREWGAAAIARFGESDEFRALEGLALSGMGRSGESLAILEPLAAKGHASVLAHCSYERLRLGDLGLAEAHALAATRAIPADQSPWAYLTIIWRLKGDPRERWLADYDRLVMPVDLEPAAGYRDIESFMVALAEELHRLHTTSEHPADQSLRQGTQTRGELFDRDLPLVRALTEQIKAQLEIPLGNLSADQDHPFLARNTGKVQFATSWSVRLRSGGFHVHHIHHKGWMSSALYVSLPPEVASEYSDAGALAFGVPPVDLGIDLEPRRVVAPKVGRLVVFPSYFWHGTIPFESEAPRLTVAFDALPA